jgi:hypothetical protein
VTEDKWCVGASGGQVECTAEAFQISGIPNCLPPHSLSFSDSDFVCACGGGYSGVKCEISPSLSGHELYFESKIQSIIAISGTGDDDFHYAADGDESTFWQSGTSSPINLTFELEEAVNITAFAIKTMDSTSAPRNVVLELSDTVDGSWVSALNVELVGGSESGDFRGWDVIQTVFVGTHQWEYWEINPSAGSKWHYFAISGNYLSRFIQLRIVSNWGGDFTRIFEVEFFKPNEGQRIQPIKGTFHGFCQRELITHYYSTDKEMQCIESSPTPPAFCQTEWIERTSISKMESGSGNKFLTLGECACGAGYSLRSLSAFKNPHGAQSHYPDRHDDLGIFGFKETYTCEKT